MNVTTMATDLDQWRTLSPKEFTSKLLSLAEEHADVLPEKAYIGLMNATKVIHERIVVHEEENEKNEEDGEPEVTSNGVVDTLSEVIIKLKREKTFLMATSQKYNGFKIMKNVTQKIREESIIHFALNRYGVHLPVASFESLSYFCGHHVPVTHRISFHKEYLEHRNSVMYRLRDALSHVEERLEYFLSRYHGVLR